MGYSATLPGTFSVDKTKPTRGRLYERERSGQRILGLATYPITFNGERYVGKHSDLFNTLAAHYNLTQVGSVQVSGWRKWQQRALYFQPRRSAWITAAYMNVMAFEERTRLAEAFLQKHDGSYDFIFQLHTMMAPGLNLGSRPYVLATDNTYILSERHWADWVPVKRDRDAWVRHESEVYRNASCIFTWSEFARQSIIHDYGIAPQKVITTGSAGGFPISAVPKEDFSKQVALFVGNDFERKGGFVLLQAWEQVRRQLPNAELWIVGPREPLAPPSPGVKWMGRIGDRDTLKDIFRQASVFVLPSLFEPFAMALLEGMGLGLPGIGAKSGGIPEMIIDGYSGYQVEPGDSHGLAEALVKLLVNPELARAMGKNAHYLAKEQFSWDVIVSRMALHIERIFASEAVTVPSRSRNWLADVEL
jgi:glycosyltransferase involved in cell wall biosynthesis